MKRLVLADDSVLLRTGLERLLTDEGFDVVGLAGNAEELLDLVADTAPDGAIIDIRMPPTHTDEGLQAALVLRNQMPRLSLLLLSQYLVTADVMTLLHPTGSGGVGYLLKDRITHIDEFLIDINRVLGGGTAIDSVVVERVLNRPHRSTSPLDELTDRE